MNINKKLLVGSLLTLISGLVVTGCGMFGNDSGSDQKNETTVAKEIEKIDIPFDLPVEIKNAKYFTIDSNNEGYYLVKTNHNGHNQALLIVPGDKEMPQNIPDSYIVVKQNPEKIQVDSQGVLSMITDIDPALLDKVKLTAMKKEEIQIPELKEKMEKGIVKTAGTISSPDVNKIKEEQIQFISVLSSVKKESMDELDKEGYKSFITYLSEENDPVCRMEWIKVFGVLLGKKAEAEKIYDEQVAKINSIDSSMETKRKVTCFYLSNDKKDVFVKTNSDYLSKLCTLSGGDYYAPGETGTDEEKLSIGDFINDYKDVDVLINLSEYGTDINALGDLAAADGGFGEMKAVKDKNVWKTTRNHYQITKLGDLAEDIYKIIYTEDGSRSGFLINLQ